MKSIYLMLTGMSLSGKSYVLKKIEGEFPNIFFPLDTRSIHNYLNQFDIYKDGNGVEGRSYEMRQESTDLIQRDLVSVVAKYGYSIAHDSCNRVKSERLDRFKQVKEINPDIKTVILYINTPNEVVLGRAMQLDEKLIKDGKEGVWVGLYNKQLETYEIPTKDEADYLITFNDDIDRLISDLKGILS